jgi:hypothetical protein
MRCRLHCLTASRTVPVVCIQAAGHARARYHTAKDTDPEDGRPYSEGRPSRKSATWRVYSALSGDISQTCVEPGSSPGPEIRRLRQSLQSDSLDDSSREKAQSTPHELKEQMRMDLAGLSGGLVLNATDHADVHVNDARSPHFFLRVAGDAIIHVNAYQGMKEPERVPHVGSLPYGAATTAGKY